MNPFLLDANSRIVEWRKLRDHIKELPLDEQLIKIAKWWSSCPIARWVLDFEDSKEWPKPWELLHDNHYCNTAIAYLMSNTLTMTYEDFPHKVELWYIDTGNDQWMCMVVNECWLLNYSHGEVFKLTGELDFKVKFKYIWDGEKFLSKV